MLDCARLCFWFLYNIHNDVNRVLLTFFYCRFLFDTNGLTDAAAAARQDLGGLGAPIQGVVVALITWCDNIVSTARDAPTAAHILDTFEFWLPFVQVRDLNISMSPLSADVGSNKMNINILFNIVRDPNTLESVQVTIGD